MHITLRSILHILLLVVLVNAMYVGILLPFHESYNAAVSATLIILAVIAEGVWLFFRSLSPLQGTFGTPDREVNLVRQVQIEVSRSLRYGSPLVIVALHLKRQSNFRSIVNQLRFSDKVIRGANGYAIILLTETQIDRARPFIERFARQNPIHALVYADYQIIKLASFAQGFGLRHEQHTMHAPTLTLLRAVQLGLFRAEARYRTGQSVPVYELTADDLLSANASVNERLMDDFTRKVA